MGANEEGKWDGDDDDDDVVNCECKGTIKNA
jgi:hypothetical protein